MELGSNPLGKPARPEGEGHQNVGGLPVLPTTRRERLSVPFQLAETLKSEIGRRVTNLLKASQTPQEEPANSIPAIVTPTSLEVGQRRLKASGKAEVRRTTLHPSLSPHRQRKYELAAKAAGLSRSRKFHRAHVLLDRLSRDR